MTNNQKSDKFKISFPQILGLIGFIWLAALTFLVLGANETLTTTSGTAVQLALNQTERSRYKEPVIDFETKKLYVYELGLSIPLNETTKDIQYSYMDNELYLSTVDTVGQQVLNDTTNPPTCDKIVLLSKVKNNYGSMTLVGELNGEKNGFKYIYKHDSCTLFTEDVQNKLIQAVESIDAF